MGVTARTFQWIFLGALIPAILAVVAMGLFVRERPAEHRRPRMPVRQTLAELGPRYWWYLAATSLFSLGYFSFAFLLLKAKAVNIGVEQQALLYGFFNLVFVLVSIPIGWIGDRLGRRTIVIASYLVYAAMCAGFLLADTQWAVLLLFALYGVFYAMDEGQAKAYLADLSHDEYRATAIGIYGFVSGLAYLPASIIAGWLWSYSPNWTFAFGILASLAASLAFAITSRGPAISTRPAS